MNGKLLHCMIFYTRFSSPEEQSDSLSISSSHSSSSQKLERSLPEYDTFEDSEGKYDFIQVDKLSSLLRQFAKCKKLRR